jgi:hypothetical protein
MTQLADFPRPMMRRAASFHSYKTAWQACEEPNQILATQSLGRNNTPSIVDGVNKKYMLGQIKANGGDR